MVKTVKNPFAKIWAREEALYSKEIGQDLTKHLRASAVQKQVDKAFAIGDSASQLDWKSKDISKATKIYRREVDKKMKGLCKSYPGLLTSSEIEMGMVKGRFLPTVTVFATYAKKYKGGKIHFVTKSDTLRSVSNKYYEDEIYWDVVEAANPKTWVEGASLEIPKMLVPDDRSKSGVTCASGGSHSPAAVAFPEVTIDFSKTVAEQKMFLPCKGLPFSLDLTFKCTGTLNAAKTGTIPVSFKYNDYVASAHKTVKGLKFSAAVKSGKLTDLLTISVGGVGKKWALSVALEAGRKVTLSAAPKPFTWGMKGFNIAGTLGFTVTVEVLPEGSGLKVGSPSMAEQIMLFPFYAAAALLMFAATRGMSPSTASGMLINNNPGSGVIGYDDAHQVI